MVIGKMGFTRQFTEFCLIVSCCKSSCPTNNIEKTTQIVFYLLTFLKCKERESGARGGMVLLC